MEKHYTVDKSLPDSPDHSFSLDPDDLSLLVKEKNRILQSRGVFVNGHYPIEGKAYQLARKSVVSIGQIGRGDLLTSKNVSCKRPGTGIPAKDIRSIYGRRATRDIPPDSLIKDEHFE